MKTSDRQQSRAVSSSHWDADNDFLHAAVTSFSPLLPSARLFLIFPTNFCAEPDSVRVYRGTRKLPQAGMTNAAVSAETPAPKAGVGKTAAGANASHVSTYAQQRKRNVTSRQENRERRVSRCALPLPLDEAHSERVDTGGAVKLGTLVTCMSLYRGSGKFSGAMPCVLGSKKSCPPRKVKY